MATYRTPGVYVEEIATLPPSVAEVSTAIPAFIGYTEVGPNPDAAGNVVPVVARINTMLEYRDRFGGASPSSFRVAVSAANGSNLRTLQSITRNTPPNEYTLYHNLSLYFQNGGGSCYIVSVGNYNNAANKAGFSAGLAALAKEDEPTLILLSDAVSLPAADYYTLCQEALAQCKQLGDRFAIFDIKPLPNDDAVGTAAVAEFRNNIGINNLAYGAAYHPYLQTTLSYDYAENLVGLESAEVTTVTWQRAFGADGILVTYRGSADDDPRVIISREGATETPTFNVSPENVLTITVSADTNGSAVVGAWQSVLNTPAAQGFTISVNGSGEDTLTATRGNGGVALDKQTTGNQAGAQTLDMLKTDNTALYNQIKAALGQQRVVLPPSAAVAGVYASVDRDRGVWKAPANVSLAAVIGPVAKITHEGQESLNVDPTGGKSINAIRAFTGKGTLIWGARTLAGNDNEWRYIPVRRLFIMIEESVQKASAFAVFEPNDATTWLKVKAMIESYLYGLWEQGALAGPTPEAAYFVNVGLGKTMTAQDVLEGRMIVDIGIAAVRPAEFIILRFTHKLQEA
ncbi:MAG: phage tail sheath family protein [Oscillochloris sp.]|nr:phage tail sheath family protein [Oscillochloris sp.]